VDLDVSLEEHSDLDSGFGTQNALIVDRGLDPFLAILGLTYTMNVTSQLNGEGGIGLKLSH
jgi:hypothetical protein